MEELRCLNCSTIYDGTLMGDRCPVCGEVNWEIVEGCDACGQYFIEEDINPVYFGYCEKCLLEALEDDDITLAFVTRSRESRIEFFLNYVSECWVDIRNAEGISAELLVEIQGEFFAGQIRTGFSGSPADIVRDFCECDLYEFSKWYDEYTKGGE